MTTKPLLNALSGTPHAVPPVWLMRQAGRYLPEYREVRAKARDFLDFCYTPELVAEATLQPVKRFGVDGAIIFSDILVIADALGQPVGFVEGRGPVLEPLADATAIRGLAPASALAEKLAPVYAALSAVRGALPKRVALIGFAGAPWTLATYMIEGGGSRDFARVKAWAYAAPDDFTQLIKLLVEAVSRHLIAQIAAGAEAVQIFDSWAGVLPEDAFRAWSIAPVSEIVKRVKAVHPHIPVIAFPNRAGVMYEAFVRETGINAVSIDASVPLEWAFDTLQAHVCVQGNLDPVALLTGGKPMETAARRIVSAFKRGAHVFNLGHGVMPQTPPDHVAALIASIRAGGAS